MKRLLIIALILFSLPSFALYKGAAGKVPVLAWDTANAAYKTGDAANITAMISKDGAAWAGLTDANPVEIGNGVYVFDISETEANADCIIVTATSATANILLAPVAIYTMTVERGTDSALLASASNEISWNAAWDSEVQSEVADAIAVYDPSTHSEALAWYNSLASDIAGIEAGSGGGGTGSGVTIGTNLIVGRTTANPATGVAIGSATPTYYVFDATGTQLLTGSMARVGGATMDSLWGATIPVTTGNGFAQDETYVVAYRVIISGATYESVESFTVTGSLDASIDANDVWGASLATYATAEPDIVGRQVYDIWTRY